MGYDEGKTLLRKLGKKFTKYVKSKRYGLYKRFYPFDYKIDDNIMYQPYTKDYTIPEAILKNDPNTDTPNIDIQVQIIEIIGRNPGITQKDLAKLVGLSITGLNYHINIMANAKVLKVERDGKWTRCYLEDEN